MIVDAGRDLRPRIEVETSEPVAPADQATDPCPEDTESLIPWLLKQFPEVTPRTSDRAVVDLCLARSGCIDLIHYINASLLAARAEQKDQ